MRTRVEDRLVDGLLAVAGAAVLLAMLVAAITNVSRAWDVGDYHLPFAARLAHVVSGDSFVFHSENQARFEGFPLLGERIQGALWRITGRAEATNLVAFATVPLLAWFLWRRLRVPPHVCAVALLAIPLVHTHATSAYVDLPANAAACVLVMIAIERWATRTPVAMGDAIASLAAAAIAANMKTLLHPLVGLTLLLLMARARSRSVLVVMVLAMPMVFATPLVNLFAHGNPYFPIRMNVLGHTLPGTEPVYAATPEWLLSAPKPVRFVCSLFEVGLRPFTDPRRWTIDQWMPSDSRGVRMGGYFSFYVAAHLTILVWHVMRERRGRHEPHAPRVAKRAALGFVCLSLVISIMPQSHELRYYLVWMLTLIALNLWLTVRDPNAPRFAARGTGLLGLAALAVVLVVTRGDYARASGTSFAELVKETVDERALDGLQRGERTCVKHEPWNIAWAREFHPGREHVVVEAEGGSTCPPEMLTR